MRVQQRPIAGMSLPANVSHSEQTGSTRTTHHFGHNHQPAIHPQNGILTVHFGGTPQNKVTLMSYNMENFFSNTKNSTIRRSSPKSEESIRALAEVIRKENPDIVAVQEVQHGTTLATFARDYLNDDYKGFCADQKNDARGICNGFLYKKDIELVSNQTFNPKDANGANILTRGMPEATFKVTTPDGCPEEITLFSAHFKAMVGGEAQTQARRLNEARAVVKRIEALLKANPQKNIAMMGDLNFKTTSSYGQEVFNVLNTAKAPQKADAWKEAFSPNFPPTHRYKQENSKLDYIFLTQNLFKDQLSTKVSGSFGVAPWSKASDHLPPVSQLKTRCQHQGQAVKTKVVPPAPVVFLGQREPRHLAYA